MGSLTLDELLDATGISDIAGTSLEKKAAAESRLHFSKLADRCRSAATAAPTAPKEPSSDLVEKTAAVEVIRRTLAEIREIEGDDPVEKTAQVNTDQAVFIRAALDEGHSPAQIAQFLEKTAVLRRGAEIGRSIGARIGYRVADAAETAGTKALKRNKRTWQDWARKSMSGSDAEKNRFLSRAARTLDPEDLEDVINDAGVAKNYSYLPYFKKLFPGGPKEPAAISGKIGGKDFSLTKKQLKSVGGPAAMIGGGAYVGRKSGGGDKDSGGGKSGRVVNIVS